jgi:Flp pilus assembly secretin CpaC
MKPRIRELAVAAILLFGAIAGARAEDDGVALGTGDAFRLFIEKAFATVIVGDPTILDVRTDDDRSVTIEPLKAGVTNLVFVDAHGMVTANIKISVCGAPSGTCATLHSSL